MSMHGGAHEAEEEDEEDGRPALGHGLDSQAVSPAPGNLAQAQAAAAHIMHVLAATQLANGGAGK
jgi:hypothetical protein